MHRCVLLRRCVFFAVACCLPLLLCCCVVLLLCRCVSSCCCDVALLCWCVVVLLLLRRCVVFVGCRCVLFAVVCCWPLVLFAVVVRHCRVCPYVGYSLPLRCLALFCLPFVLFALALLVVEGRQEECWTKNSVGIKEWKKRGWEDKARRTRGGKERVGKERFGNDRNKQKVPKKRQVELTSQARPGVLLNSRTTLKVLA